jgi:hypothetical protein
MSQIPKRILLVTTLLAATLLAGCRAKPAPSAGFADAELMQHDPNVPFHKIWRKPDVNWNNYDTVYVADVNTALMLSMTDWKKGERKDEIEKDVANIAVYCRDTVKKAFLDDPNKRFQLTGERPNSARALVFEMALVELVPSKVSLNALGYAPFGIGLAVSGTRTVAGDKSTAAFEARVRDAATGEIILLAADREQEDFALIDLRGFKWYTHIHAIIDSWSRQWVRVLEQKPGERIKDTDTFRLLPW